MVNWTDGYFVKDLEPDEELISMLWLSNGNIYIIFKLLQNIYAWNMEHSNWSKSAIRTQWNKDENVYILCCFAVLKTFFSWDELLASVMENNAKLQHARFGNFFFSNGNIFRVTGPLCGEFTGPGEFPTQMPVTRSFDVYFDLRLNKRLCKQSRGWWFETLLCPLWRHSNGMQGLGIFVYCINKLLKLNSCRIWPTQSSKYYVFKMC